jgi:hypothetical protein
MKALLLALVLCGCASYREAVVTDVRPLADGSLEIQTCTLASTIVGDVQVTDCRTERRSRP